MHNVVFLLDVSHHDQGNRHPGSSKHLEGNDFFLGVRAFLPDVTQPANQPHLSERLETLERRTAYELNLILEGRPFCSGGNPLKHRGGIFEGEVLCTERCDRRDQKRDMLFADPAVDPQMVVVRRVALDVATFTGWVGSHAGIGWPPYQPHGCG